MRRLLPGVLLAATGLGMGLGVATAGTQPAFAPTWIPPATSVLLSGEHAQCPAPFLSAKPAAPSRPKPQSWHYGLLHARHVIEVAYSQYPSPCFGSTSGPQGTRVHVRDRTVVLDGSASGVSVLANWSQGDATFILGAFDVCRATVVHFIEYLEPAD